MATDDVARGRVRRPQLHAAAGQLMAAVLGDLAARDGMPVFATVPDFGEWHRHGQESFVAIRRGAWQMPARVTDYRFLDTFAEMAAVRAVVAADQVLRERVDCLVGLEFALTLRQLGPTLVKHVLEPMVAAVRGYRFDQEAFDAAYSRLEDGLLATRARLVEVVPLNAFTPHRGHRGGHVAGRPGAASDERPAGERRDRLPRGADHLRGRPELGDRVAIPPVGPDPPHLVPGVLSHGRTRPTDGAGFWRAGRASQPSRGCASAGVRRVRHRDSGDPLPTGRRLSPGTGADGVTVGATHLRRGATDNPWARAG
ncbi:hypothetical protein [Micromonospora tulbaghiae]|uniref:hypothetical protein n=1 Tax=Micromonospora tulbaghiae TaxID=479978 RepID=UPI003EBFC219